VKINTSSHNHYYYRGICEHDHNFRLPRAMFGTKNMYVCSRCLGLYGGIVAWTSVLIILPQAGKWFNALDIVAVLGTCFLLTLPLVVDWWLQCKAMKHSSNPVRFITGLLTSLSGVIMITSFQYWWLTVPAGICWTIFVMKAGTRWKRNRPPGWGCHACRGEFPHAIPLLED
jgi:uncharacterized membrane protein